MAGEPRSNRSVGLIAAIYLFKMCKRKEKKCFNDPRLSGGMLMRRAANKVEQPSNISRGCGGLLLLLLFLVLLLLVLFLLLLHRLMTVFRM